MATHIYVRPQKRVMDRGTVGCIFSVTIAGFPVLDSAIGYGFLHASVGFRQIIHTSHAEILYANIR